jgi:glyoxylase-like metal-dependent hydrolase (beta-lactamase superfamily II)
MITVKSFMFNPVQENTYILYNEQLICGIIDPGCYFNAERKELREFISEYKLTPNYLLNTHCHLDHVFGNKFVFDTYSIHLHIHPEEKPVLAYAPVSANSWNLPFENYNDKLIYINEGNEIMLGEDKLKVLFTPGHSPGHVGFYCEEQKFIIGGDVLFRGSIGRTDLPGGHHETLLKSIRQQLFTLPDDVMVYPGHGEPTTIGYERKNNPFFR